MPKTTEANKPALPFARQRQRLEIYAWRKDACATKNHVGELLLQS
jgi:hypothetical protein